MNVSLETLRANAVGWSLFPPKSLAAAVRQLGFVQADPIRAPARAQDLILFQRVKGYRAGDLERRYGVLDLEEDHFINYGFLPRDHVALMHPRVPRRRWSPTVQRRAQGVLDFVHARKTVHPREVDDHFEHGRVTNAWGGSSSATTALLDDLHYRGQLRVVRREKGIRIYAPSALSPSTLSPEQQLDALVDIAVRQYAPVPKSTLTMLVSRLRYCAPQLARLRPQALRRALGRYRSAHAAGVDWFWPENLSLFVDVEPRVRLLAPFDPVVWDRKRVELLWGWQYRFEAYTPVKLRKLGYYALPMLFGDQLIGWGNLSTEGDRLRAELGYVSGKAPGSAAFRRALEAELERFGTFLGATRN